MNYFKNENTLYFAKLSNEAKIPTKNEEDAGYDIYACIKNNDDFVIQPMETKLVPTKIACAMSPKYYLQIEERSSTGSKGIKKSAGIIDSGYRGEIMVAITNSTKKTLVLSNKTLNEISQKLGLDESQILLYPQSKAIAECLIHEVPKMDIQEIEYEELKNIPSLRKTGGFGSTNK